MRVLLIVSVPPGCYTPAANRGFLSDKFQLREIPFVRAQTTPLGAYRHSKGKRSPTTVALLVAALWLALGQPARAATVQGDMKIYILNIGQGDAILIVCPHGTHRMLIDTAARGYPMSQEAFKQQLGQLVPGPQAHLDVVVATHPHDDHVGGLYWVLQSFKVSKFIDNGKDYTPTFKKIRTLAQTQQKAGTLKYFSAAKAPSKIVDFCPATNLNADLLVPKEFGKAKNVNNNSVVVRVTYNKLSFVFTGDAEKQEEAQLFADPLTKPRLGGAVFYKVGHHGAETSSTLDLLAQMKPQWAAVSSGRKNIGKNNGYRHPRAGTLNALLGVITSDADKEIRTVDAGESGKGEWTTVKIHKRIYVTAKDGSIVFLTDGNSVQEQPAGLTNPLDQQ